MIGRRVLIAGSFCLSLCSGLIVRGYFWRDFYIKNSLENWATPEIGVVVYGAKSKFVLVLGTLVRMMVFSTFNIMGVVNLQSKDW